MASWPSGVPENALAGTLSEQQETNVAQFQPEVGPPIRRRRSSIAVVNLRFQTMMTAAQYATLQTFFTDTLEDGSLSFTRVHPRTGSTVTVEFADPLSYTEQTLGALQVSINLRVLP